MNRADRFWSKVQIAGPDDCWEWTASRNGAGYGQIWNRRIGRPDLAHRMAYELAHDQELPPGRPGPVVMHTCDNRTCVNPAHLVLATQRDNVADMERKGRSRRPRLRGELGPLAKLKWDDILEIRSRYAKGDRQVDLAEKFKVSQSTISSIVRCETWR